MLGNVKVNFFKNRYKFDSARLCVVVATLFLIVVISPVSPGQSSESHVAGHQIPSEVGYVSLVLGKAYIQSEKKRERVFKGLSVSVGDLVYTENNGHVHIRFVDEALVSVRPRSSLEIERYEFNRKSPEKSAVKFNLVEGVARSISGEAAKSARQRFRLNTPVAAIGVRGTDFVVSANSVSTKALVNEGSIVMAPFSNLCTSDALGPCSQNAVELAGDAFQVLEINGNSLLPPVEADQAPRSIANLRDRFRLAGQNLASAADSDERDAASAYLEVAASGKVREASLGSPGDSSSLSEAKDFTPQVPLSATDVGQRQLVWGRFGEGNRSSESLSVERLVAAEDRNITIAASNYLLYRTELAGARMDSNLGVIGFNLDSAQAFFNSESGEVAMRVTSGSLDVDLINNSFITGLDLEHSSTGEISFTGSGRVADGGYLIGLEEAKSVLGAVATDGLEAGYFFEQQLQTGFISGLTLWGGR